MNGLTPAEDRALKAVAVQFFINGAVVASYVPRLPGIRDRLGVDLATIGVILAVATGCGLLGSLVQGPVVQRFGTRQSLIGGGVALLLLLPLVGFASHWLVLLLILGALSVSDVVVDVAMNMQGSTLSARRNKPVMNRLHGMWSLGTVIGGIVASALAAFDVSLRIHLIGASVVLALALLYVAPGLVATDPTEEEAAATAARTSAAPAVALTFAVLGGAAILPEMINSDWAAFRLTDDLGASAGVAGIAYVAFTSGMVTGRFAGDEVVSRLGSTVVLRWATALAAIGTVLATLIPVTASVFVGLFIAGLGVSVMFPQLYDAAAQHARPRKALGGLTAGTRGALLVAPFLVGRLADSDQFTVGGAIAVAAIPGALVVLLLSRLVTSANEE